MIIQNNKIKSLLFCIFLITCSFGNTDCIKGDGRLETFSKSNFSIDTFLLDGMYDVEIILATNSKIEILAESNIMKTIKTKVAKNILSIKQTHSICPTKSIHVKLYIDTLKKLALQGATTVNFDISSPSLALELDGSHELSGQGKVDNLIVDTQGSNEISILNLETKKTKLQTEGMLDIRLTAIQKLFINASGMVDIQVKGGATIEKKSVDGLINIEKL